MANGVTLLIIKNEGAETNFSHQFSIGLDYMNSDFEFTIQNGEFQIKELNGSAIYPITWSDVTLRDDSSGVTGVPYTATSPIDLYNKLDALGYTPFLNVSGAITGMIEAGLNVNITGSGTVADPYVISASTTGAMTYINGSADIDVTGDGSVGDPYVITYTGGTGYDSLQAMYDADPAKLDVTDGSSTTKIRPDFIESGDGTAKTTILSSGAVIVENGTGGDGAIESGQVSGAIDGGSFALRASGASGAAELNLSNNDAEDSLSVSSDKIVGTKLHHFPNAPDDATYAASVKIGATTYSADDNGKIDLSGAIGGGAVDSVNGQTGVVVLDADDIDDSSTTNKWTTDAEKATFVKGDGTQATEVDLGNQDVYNLANLQVNNGVQGKFLLLDGDSSPTHSAGKLVYDTTNDCFTAYNSDANVALQIGQEQWIRVRNVSGSTITNGSAVYINGTSSSTPTVTLAQANSGTTTVVAGIATESIANNSFGYITSLGVVRGLDTSSFSVGAVYLSPSVAGGLTQTIPTAPNYRYRIGFITNVNATTGTIHVTPSTASLGNGTSGQVLSISASGIQEWTSNVPRTVAKSVVNTTAVTGTTAETITVAILIPANTYAVGDIMQFSCPIRKVGIAGTSTVRAYINTSAAIPASSQQIAQFAVTGSNVAAALVRNTNLVQSGNLLDVFTPTQNTTNDEAAVSVSARGTVTFDPTVTNYLVITTTNTNSADTTRLAGYHLLRI